ncbi:FtsQ-type POTRA domain-containing protein [Streptomyces sp. VRA16 Mangrove soil]|uniref:cell division protein FtsQ/DivIB n=1 Tax=Streptomyces sp. VRA16 Mangrove soil TaxID=2817434 RepID=UPI001A9F211B|nr:FtsQ-type POTRA domain-containing protein [Streptomyces sp. VRA16 Mangrove soil]MBO1333414.1 FtsQ-type POTRA domain-containing protein [Streptomyces sp. VRA16 Mangrove soil]
MAGPALTDREDTEASESGPPSRRFRVPRVRTLVVTGVLLVLIGAGGTWLLYGSQWLRVERVTTSGTEVLTPAEVRDAAAVPVGAPLISVDTGAIEDRLRQKLPRIDSVDVVRSWPHGIRLKVTERKPVLMAEDERNSGKFVEVDREGVRFATIEKALKGVPRLELTPDQEGAAASLRRFGPERLTREAVRIAGRLPKAIAGDTRTVKVRSYDDISLVLADGRTVAWGSGEQSGQKARALAALMKAAPKARHFDVSVPTAPASAGS